MSRATIPGGGDLAAHRGEGAAPAAEGFRLPAGTPEYRDVLDALAMVPGWWRQRAAAAGLTGNWTDWRRALPGPPVPVPDDAPPPSSTTRGCSVGPTARR